MSDSSIDDEIRAREQAVSSFALILHRLVDATPGAVGAALADEEGETVDFYGDGDPDDLKLAAAYMGILLNRVDSKKTKLLNGKTIEIRIRGQYGQFVTRALGLGYQVTVVLETTATLPKLEEALEQAIAELRLEAGGVLD